MTVRTRFAPSPTGYLHIGGARTALYCWLEARHRGGEFILRIEDTDRERSTQEAVQAILDGMRWLGLAHDEGPYYQTLRMDRYRQVAEDLLRAGKAYHCWCSKERLEKLREEQMAQGLKPRYDGHCRHGAQAVAGVTPVIRFRNPDGGSVVFHDKVKGRIEWSNAELDDLVLFRSDGFPTYNFAVVVDDIDMKITDVIRGDDHLSNTPKQLLVLSALGEAAPRYAHLPLLHGPDGKKLSKRHGAASAQELRDDGFLPEAVRNYLALLGWGSGDDETILTTPELIERFSIERVGRAAAIFDAQKLRWLNGRYMRVLDLSVYEREIAARLERTDPEAAAAFAAATPELRREACAIVQEKAQTLAEVWPLISFLFTEPVDDEKAWRKVMKPELAAVLAREREVIATVEPFDPAALERELRALLEEEGVGAGKGLQPIRVAITGTNISPGIFESLVALGRERSLRRIDRALERLRDSSGEDSPAQG